VCTDVVDLVLAAAVVNAVMVCNLSDAVAMVVSAAALMVDGDADEVDVFIFFVMGALLIFCIPLNLFLTDVLLLGLFVLLSVVELVAADTNCDVVEFLFIVDLDIDCLGANVSFAALLVSNDAVEVVNVAVDDGVDNCLKLFAAANAESVLTSLLDGDLVELFLLLYMFVVNTSL
jgi:hypothetical protein